MNSPILDCKKKCYCRTIMISKVEPTNFHVAYLSLNGESLARTRRNWFCNSSNRIQMPWRLCCIDCQSSINLRSKIADTYSLLSNKRGHQINMDLGQKFVINKCGQWNECGQLISTGKPTNMDRHAENLCNNRGQGENEATFFYSPELHSVTLGCHSYLLIGTNPFCEY